MALSISPSILRPAVLFALVSIHMTWLRYLNEHVPEPYLDEVFHVPQAQVYWAGRWSHWDDKITTPPGLYLWSYAFNVVRRLTAADSSAMVTVEDLRFSNAVLIYVLMVTLYLWVAVARKPVDGEKVLQRELVVMGFPLLFFFSGLYYTDVFSAWTVVASCVMWEGGKGSKGVVRLLFQVMHLALGLVSLASRQTNIFWVAVFLAGLQVVETVQAGMKVDGLRDPEVGEAGVEDIFSLIFQLLPAAVMRLPNILLALWPQLFLLGSFAAFVLWNGGVVLGDKSNHVATIHLPQLLYIWPCFVFFSWPALLPQLTNLQRLRRQLPRPWLAALIMLAMTGAVHYNTIVHPFTLADNRHYVFYVFRILMRKWWIKYAAVPVYFICASLVISALGGGRRNQEEDGTVRLSLVLIWFASTALSLVTAPLVEPRYFIVPWLVWRMYVPEFQGSSVDMKAVAKDGKSSNAKGIFTNIVQRAPKLLAEYSLWVELSWYLLINYATCWMFLYRGFEWKQEPDNVQRFMW